MPTDGPLSALFDAALSRAIGANEVGWYASRVGEHGAPVLDAMCGSGRLLVPLVERGLSLHGVDASAAKLSACETALAERGLAVALFRQHPAQLNLPLRYRAAFVAGGALQRVADPTAAAAAAALQRLRAHLVDPGVLLIDLFVPAEASRRYAAPLVELHTANLPDGSRIALRCETVVDVDARLARSERRYVHRRGATAIAEEHQSATLTWYARDDAAALVEGAGFRHVEIVDSPSPDDGLVRFAVIARA